MLKRIKPGQARLGMFIEAIEGSWADHPFWRNQFRLDRAKDVERLKSSHVTAVIIDTDKGVDVALPIAMTERSSAHPRENLSLKRALRTIEQSKPLITEIFENARIGGTIPVSHAAQAVEHIAACMQDSGKALIEVTRLKARDEYTFLHSIAVSGLVVHLARFVGLDEKMVRDLGMGGLLHDIGKMRVPLKVLNKSAPLNDVEMGQVRLHPSHGYQLLAKQGDVPRVVLDICLHHHERIDGSGYPNGLFDKQISIAVRITSICDVYDALTSARAYKKAWNPRDAARFMLEQEGQFDRRLLRQLFHSLRL
ncbi:HD-GYP domain-containing protein [Rhizobium giardinii]|uniref:HD-GYP domain-containing protein n=1 Tax=Rhizobium giardinii TaxID=56731 RepID=UPI003D6E0C78